MTGEVIFLRSKMIGEGFSGIISCHVLDHVDDGDDSAKGIDFASEQVDHALVLTLTLGPQYCLCQMVLQETILANIFLEVLMDSHSSVPNGASAPASNTEVRLPMAFERDTYA